MKIEKQKYVLVMKKEFEAFDDIQAREIARRLIGVNVNKMKIKLQKIYEDKAPEGMKIDG